MTPQESPVLIGQVLDELHEFNLEEFCVVCSVEEHHVIEMIDAGIIEPRSLTELRFGIDALRRARAAWRLQRDLGINPAGAALVLDLLERIDVLQRRVRSGG